MIILWVILAVILAAFIGWYVGHKDYDRHSVPRISERLRRDYFLGLNHLINEQPDKAVDVFIKLLEVDSETVETHLALGSLFRRRGEVDRAIHIHQNLIARPQLDKRYRIHALSELGQDYLKAGILGRAERLFSELAEVDGSDISSLKYLLHIYQQEKDWEKAIEAACKLESMNYESMHTAVAQYYCELAKQLYERGRANQAQQHLKRAFSIDPRCVRASLLSGQIAIDEGNYKQAIRYYKQVREQDPMYLSETVGPLVSCFSKLHDETAMVHYFKECLDKYPRVSIVLVLSKYLQEHYGDKAAIEFIAQQISKSPSLRGLNRLVEIYLVNASAEVKQKLLILKDLIGYLLENKPLYQCTHCGFSTKIIHWLCPSCFSWNTVKPVQGLEAK